MNKILIVLCLCLVMLSSFAIAEKTLVLTGNTEDISAAGSGSRAYATDVNQTTHFIAKTNNAVYEFSYDTWSSLGISTGSINGKYIDSDWNDIDEIDNFFVSVDGNNSAIRQYEFTSPNWQNVQTTDLNFITPSEPLDSIRTITIDKDLNTMFVANQNDKTVYVYTYDFEEITGFADFSYSYQFTFDHDFNGTATIWGVIYEDFLFLYDQANNEVYQHTFLGDLIETYTVDVPANTYRDLFFYENDLYFINVTGQEVVGYEINITTPPVNNFTLNNVSYNLANYCISSTQLCNDTNITTDILGNVIISCNSPDAVTFCSNTCTNTEIDGILNGECTQLGCTNECDINGQTSCSTLNTYQICGQFDADACLELGNPLFCPVNQVCSDGQCSAQVVNTTDDYVQNGLVVSADVVSSNAYFNSTALTEVREPNVLNALADGLSFGLFSIAQTTYKTIFENLETEYSITASSGGMGSVDYYAYSCDFTQSYPYQQYFTNNANGFTGGVRDNEDSIYFYELDDDVTATFSSVSTPQEVELMFKPLNSSVTTIEFLDSSTSINNLVIEYNLSEKNLLIYDLEAGYVYVNETSTKATDDLERVVFVAKTVPDVNSISYEIITIRNVNGVDIPTRYYTLPLAYVNNLAESINTVHFNSSDTTLLFQLLHKTTSELPSYSTGTQAQSFECVYSRTGCNGVRVWANQFPTATYHFYQDLQVCVGEVNGEVDADIQQDATGRDFLEDLFNEDFTDNDKTLISVVAILFTLGIFIYMYSLDREKIFLIFGSVASGIVMFFFISIAYFPAWIIILFIVLGALGVLWFTTRGR